MRKLLGMSVAILGLAVLPGLAEAGPIVGEISLSGNNVRVTATTIDWYALGGPSGTITVTAGSDYFAGLVGETDTLLDLDLASFPPGPEQPALDGFQTISNTGLDFSLTRIATCAETGIPALCLAGTDSPFVFTPLGGGGTTVSIAFAGTVIDTTNPGFLSTWTGNFSADSNLSGAQLINQLLTVGFVDLPYSGTKIAVDVPNEVPEPASMLLLGSGLFGLVARARKRSKKA